MVLSIILSIGLAHMSSGPIVQGSTVPEYNLTVTIFKIKEIQGTVRVCLIDNDQDKYLSTCDRAESVVVEAGEETVVFEDLPAGEYCISLYQDLDDNQRLNLDGMFGLPSEPYGFSNNARGIIGPPSLKKCVFTVSADREMRIKL